MPHDRRSDHHHSDHDHYRSRDRDSDYGYRDRRDVSSRYQENYDDYYTQNPKPDIKKALEGFSIPKTTKSLTDTINEKLLLISSTTTTDTGSSKTSMYGNPGKKNFCAGKKRTFEEVSSYQSWARGYQPALPDDVMLLCCSDRCNLCGVDITSPALRDAHYTGAKHGKKVRARLADLFPDDATRPKMAKLDSSTDSGVAAALDFFKKIENQVDRDPTKATYGDMKLEEWQRIWMEKWDRALPPAIVSMCRIQKCDICEASFNSGLMAKSHYEGKNHEKKLRACLELYCSKHDLELPRRITSHSEESFKQSDNICKLCDVELTSETMANIHYSGKKHIDKKLKQMANLATTSATEDKTGRFGIGSRFVKKETEIANNSSDDLKDGLNSTWGETDTKPVPLMSLNVGTPLPLKNQSPPKKTALQPDSEKYTCDVCCVECLGRQSWEAHNTGKAHMKKLGAEIFHCEVCNVTSPNLNTHEMHIRGKAHAKKRDAGEERQEGGKLNCDLCMVTCTDEEQLRKHVEGKKHQAKCKSKSESIFKCTVCNVTTTDQNGLNMHLKVIYWNNMYKRIYHMFVCREKHIKQ